MREWKKSEEGKRIEDIEIEKYVGEKGEEKQIQSTNNNIFSVQLKNKKIKQNKKFDRLDTTRTANSVWTPKQNGVHIQFVKKD